MTNQGAFSVVQHEIISSEILFLYINLRTPETHTIYTMFFNSIEFAVFLPIVFCLYWFVCNRSLKWQNLLILTASYVFYGWWNYKFLGLLVLSTLIDYSFGFWVASDDRRKKKLFLILSILNNLLVLGVFKYYNFFALETKAFLENIGFHVSPYLLDVVLPVGISFYTFHGMSYAFDIYRGNFKPVRSFVDYAVFVSFFPLLVAGPIERAAHLLPQVKQKRVFDYTQAVQGCKLILWGLFKKVVVADSLAPVVNDIFGRYKYHSGSTLILGAIYFSFQIYGDFSGYSDIAIGTGKLFGFELLSNFKFPYFSRDVAEFWRRWHISLSSWFRDYLYFPLGGSRNGKLVAVRNTFIIFLVSGFWHGASWKYITWGFVHACGFLPLLLINKNRSHVLDVVAEHRKWPSFYELLQMLWTFTFVTFAWIFFRADGFAHAIGYIKAIFVNHHNLMEAFLYKKGLPMIAFVILCDWLFRRDARNISIGIKNAYARTLVYAIIATITLIYFCINSTTYGASSFIYFQF